MEVGETLMASRYKIEPEKLLEESVSRVKEQLGDLLDAEGSFSDRSKSASDNFGLEDLWEDLSYLFQVKRIENNESYARGFPGIVLTAVVGRLVDQSYDPIENFYDISPRTLFEKKIRPVLHGKHGVPMGKSDPLNVAKNAQKIDAEWAKGRRPEYAAKAAAKMFDVVAGSNDNKLRDLLDLLVWYYLAIAKLYSKTLARAKSGITLNVAHSHLLALIEQAPEGGATPQAIVGAVLQSHHDVFGADKSLSGVGESINATNTTAGKPGDFCEESESEILVYEVSVKKVDEQRVVESSEAVRAYLEKLGESPEFVSVTFLCPSKEIAIEELEEVRVSAGPIERGGITFIFVDLNLWLLVMLERVGAVGRNNTFEYLDEFASNNERSLKFRTQWDDMLAKIKDNSEGEAS